MVLYRMPIMILTMSLVYIFIVPDEPFLFKLVFKLIPMVIIIFFAFRLLPKERSRVHLLLIAGLLFSLFSDTMFHWFFIGLTFSFISLICYITGFFTIGSFTKGRTISIIPIIIIAVLIGIKLISSLKSPHAEELTFLIIAYIVLLSFLLWAAILSGNKIAIFGSFLFIISYLLQSWHLFIGSLSFESFIIIAYYSAQFLIALSLQSIVSAVQRVVW